MSDEWQTCPRCHGDRVIITRVGKNKFESTCPTCGGSGQVPKR